MVDPLTMAIGARAQEVLEKSGVNVEDIEIDHENGEYVITCPSGDVDISGGVVRIKQQ